MKNSMLLLQYNELVDKVTSSETKVSEMETTVEDLQWDIEKLRNREQKLNKHLAEAMEQVHVYDIVCDTWVPLLLVWLCFICLRDVRSGWCLFPVHELAVIEF